MQSFNGFSCDKTSPEANRNSKLSDVNFNFLDETGFLLIFGLGLTNF